MVVMVTMRTVVSTVQSRLEDTMTYDNTIRLLPITRTGRRGLQIDYGIPTPSPNPSPGYLVEYEINK